MAAQGREAPYTPSEQLGASPAAATAAIADLRKQLERANAAVKQLLRERSEVSEGQLSERRLAANERLVVTALQAQGDADAATRALDLLSRSSQLDSLTDLPNRQSLLSRFNYAIAVARRTGTQLALLFIDLNNFKQINDALGHAVGDQVLRLTARRLATAVRESDTVSRHGGDEFLVLLTDVSHATDVVAIATKIIAALGRPARVAEHVLRLTASIGISLYPNDGGDSGTLINCADAAMYQTKRNGEGGFAFYGTTSPEDGATSAPVLSALHHPLSHYRAALAEQARRHVQLRDANEQLVFAALSAQKLQDAAEQAQRRQTAFLAVLAHELRNPLVPMQYAATLLHRARADPSLLPRIQSMIERQVGHMARLVGDLLDVSRTSNGKLRLHRQLADLVAIVDGVVAACRPGMDARLQHFVVRIPGGPIEYYGDSVRLAQIIGNLLDNASKYTPEGGEIGLTMSQSEASILITVSDSGIGMSKEILETIFEPFVQDASAIEFNGAGLGIGLTVVRELVTAHGGTISARSSGLGRGSTFIVTLPGNGRSPPCDSTSQSSDEKAGPEAPTGMARQ